MTNKTTIVVSHMVQTTRGFHIISLSKSSINAILRGHKASVEVSASAQPQKGDWLALAQKKESFCLPETLDAVYEITNVTFIPHSTQTDGFGVVVLNISRIPKATYHEGDIGGEYKEDTIVIED